MHACTSQVKPVYCKSQLLIRLMQEETMCPPKSMRLLYLMDGGVSHTTKNIIINELSAALVSLLRTPNS